MKNEIQIEKVETKAQAFNIETLIGQAISTNTPVESLERLLALRKQLKDEWAKEEFIKALAAFQKECPTIEKKSKVAFGTTKYSYAPLEVITEQVQDLLSKNGFSYMFDTETNGKMKVICKIYHTAGHMEPTKFDMEIDATAKMNVSQKYGSALTYAKRYAFCAALGINVKDEDTDMAPAKTEEQKVLPEYIIKMINSVKNQDELNEVYRIQKTKFQGELYLLFVAECQRRKSELTNDLVDEIDKALG